MPENHRRDEAAEDRPEDLPENRPEDQPDDRDEDKYEDTDEDRGVEGAGREDARDRLGRALFRPGKAQIVVAVLLALLGYAAVTQIRANDLDDTYAGYREQDLIDVLRGLAGANERADAEAARLQEVKQDLTSDNNSRKVALDELKKEQDSLAVLSGSVPVEGPGLRITINDPEGKVDINDLLDIVEELKTARAEAIEFDDEVRLGVTSSFESTDDGVDVDGATLNAPYTIDVIGDPDTLEGALTFSQGPIDVVEDAGGTLTYDRLDNVSIDSVVTPARPEYAELLPGK